MSSHKDLAQQQKDKELKKKKTIDLHVLKNHPCFYGLQGSM